MAHPQPCHRTDARQRARIEHQRHLRFRTGRGARQSSAEPGRRSPECPHHGGRGPVSYTHLDVYKRQAACRMENTCSPERFSQAGTLACAAVCSKPRSSSSPPYPQNLWIRGPLACWRNGQVLIAERFFRFAGKAGERRHGRHRQRQAVSFWHAGAEGLGPAPLVRKGLNHFPRHAVGLD